MSFKLIASAVLLITSAAPAFAEGGVRIEAPGVVITEDRIEAPGVSIQTGKRAAPDKEEPAQGNDYTNADITGMDFRGQDLRKAVFVNATLTNVNFEDADLRGADFTNADLDGANLNGANLEGADLTNATFSGTQMLDVNLKNAILTNADFDGAIKGKRPHAPQSPVRESVRPAAEIKKALVAPNAKIDLTVNFDFNSDKLTAQGREQILQAALALGGMGKAAILVQGHTDNVGADDYNKTLSERRAEAVVRELKASGKGLPGIDLIAKGYGEAEPVDTNDTDLGRAKNRRVTLVNVTKAD